MDGYIRLATEVATAEVQPTVDTGDLISEAFDQLPERWRQVLVAVEIEGRRPAQLAPELGLSPNAVSALVARARRGLRVAYRDAHRREERRLANEPLGAELFRAS
jgi:RNA polymerase sigma factor (sigma-70 family)